MAGLGGAVGGGMIGGVAVTGGTGEAGVTTVGFCSAAGSGFFSVTGMGAAGCGLLGGGTSMRGETTTGEICTCGKGSRNGNRLASFWAGRLFGGWCSSRRCCSELGLEFADGALQFCELFRVFFGEIVQLFAKSGMPDVKTNSQKGRGEQYQHIETKQEVKKGHGSSSDVPLG